MGSHGFGPSEKENYCERKLFENEGQICCIPSSGNCAQCNLNVGPGPDSIKVIDHLLIIRESNTTLFMRRLSSLSMVSHFISFLFLMSLMTFIHSRVAKSHGYNGYIRVKIFAGWGKKSGRRCNLAKFSLFCEDLHNYARFLCIN